MTGNRRTALSLLATVATVAAGVGCLLPWERVEVDAGGPQTTSVSALHGWGAAACALVAAASLLAAHRLLRPRRHRLREAAAVVCGAGVALGAGLMPWHGGLPPASGAGYSVHVAPALIVAGVAGAVLAVSAGALLSGPRAG